MGGVEPGEPRSEVADFRLPRFGEGVEFFFRMYPAGPDWPFKYSARGDSSHLTSVIDA